MKKVFEIREKIIEIYYKYDVFILPVLKLIIAFIVLHTVNSKMGYFTKIDNVAVELIASLLCSFLPSGMILVFAGLFTLLHMYGLSLIVAGLGAVLYIVLYLLFLRFSPKSALVVAVLPVLMLWKIPYMLPIILGLAASPGTVVAAGCGVVAYYFLHIINSNSATIATMELSDVQDQFKLLIDSMLANKGMIIVVIAFTVTIIVVYLVRRLPIKRNWEIAIGAGAVLQILILLIGDVKLDTGISPLNVILGSVLGVAIAFALKFFKFCVDFNRSERVQFEDDDYYYYVKAVPKINLGAGESGRVRHISRRMARKPFIDSWGQEVYDDGIDENYDYEEGEYYEEGSEEYEPEEYYEENYDSGDEQ